MIILSVECFTYLLNINTINCITVCIMFSWASHSHKVWLIRVRVQNTWILTYLLYNCIKDDELVWLAKEIAKVLKYLQMQWKNRLQMLSFCVLTLPWCLSIEHLVLSILELYFFITVRTLILLKHGALVSSKSDTDITYTICV